MYSPKIREDLIPRIYRVAKESNIPMTVWVNQAVEKSLPEAVPEPNPTTQRRSIVKTVQPEQKSNRLEEQFIIAKSENGYRVCAALSPGKQYIVTGVPDNPECTCENFVHPERPPDWQCEHILAVLRHGAGLNGSEPQVVTIPKAGSSTNEPPTGGKNGKKSNGGRNGKGAVILLKRSVSPDGRIDALSIELSCPLGTLTGPEIKDVADKMLSLQAIIAAEFLTTASKNGNDKATHQRNGGVPKNAVPARIIGVGTVGRNNDKPVLNVLVGERVLKFFGSEKELADAVKAVGHDEVSGKLSDGMKFDLPCRVVTKQNGKYTNVEQLYPVERKSVERGS